MLIYPPEKDLLLLKIANVSPQNRFTELKGKRHFVIRFPVVCLDTLEHVASLRSSPLQRFLSQFLTRASQSWSKRWTTNTSTIIWLVGDGGRGWKRSFLSCKLMHYLIDTLETQKPRQLLGEEETEG